MVGLDAKAQGKAEFGLESVKTVCYGLHACAAVIYASNNKNAKNCAWVHHANTESVSLTDVNTAIDELGNPPLSSVFVVFAHMGSGFPCYNESMAINLTTQQPDVVEHSDQLLMGHV
jgi:hypothetical protein